MRAIITQLKKGVMLLIDAKKMSERMYELRLSQADLARKTGLSPGYISDLMNGRRGKRLGGASMLKLAAALEMEPLFFAHSFVYANKSECLGVRKGRISGGS